MEVPNDIARELLHTWRKPDVCPISRAEFLRNLIDQEGLSQRDFGNKFDIPKSTLTGWLAYGKVTKEEYKEMQEEGLSERTIHESLKRTGLKIPLSNIEHDLERCISILYRYDKNPNVDTNPKIDDKLSRLKLLIEKIEGKLK